MAVPLSREDLRILIGIVEWYLAEGDDLDPDRIEGLRNKLTGMLVEMITSGKPSTD